MDLEPSIHDNNPANHGTIRGLTVDPPWTFRGRPLPVLDQQGTSPEGYNVLKGDNQGAKSPDGLRPNRDRPLKVPDPTGTVTSPLTVLNQTGTVP